MIIEQLQAPDIEQDNSIFLLKPDSSSFRCRISALTFLATRRLSAESLVDCSQAACARMASYLNSRPAGFSQYRYYLFGFSKWNQPNAIARKRLLWAQPDLRSITQAALRLGPQVAVVDIPKQKLIVAGAIEFSIEYLFPIVEAVRTGCYGVMPCAILLSRDESVMEPDVMEEIYWGINERETRLDWHRCLQLCCCAKNYQVIRAFGGFDDREVAVDLFSACPAPSHNAATI